MALNFLIPSSVSGLYGRFAPDEDRGYLGRPMEIHKLAREQRKWHKKGIGCENTAAGFERMDSR
jgi:hypothetical protein